MIQPRAKFCNSPIATFRFLNILTGIIGSLALISTNTNNPKNTAPITMQEITAAEFQSCSLPPHVKPRINKTLPMRTVRTPRKSTCLRLARNEQSFCRGSLKKKRSAKKEMTVMGTVRPTKSRKENQKMFKQVCKADQSRTSHSPLIQKIILQLTSDSDPPRKGPITDDNPNTAPSNPCHFGRSASATISDTTVKLNA